MTSDQSSSFDRFFAVGVPGLVGNSSSNSRITAAAISGARSSGTRQYRSKIKRKQPHRRHQTAWPIIACQ